MVQIWALLEQPGVEPVPPPWVPPDPRHQHRGADERQCERFDVHAAERAAKLLELGVGQRSFVRGDVRSAIGNQAADETQHHGIAHWFLEYGTSAGLQNTMNLACDELQIQVVQDGDAEDHIDVVVFEGRVMRRADDEAAGSRYAVRFEPLAGQWSLPGGMLELGESLEAGLAREMLEETGLHVDVGPVVEVFDRILFDDDGRVRYHFVLVDYVCTVRGGTLASGSDVADVALADPGDLEQYRLAAKARDVIEKARRFAS